MITMRVNDADLRNLYRRLSPIERTIRLRAGMMESQQYLQGQIQQAMAVDSGRGRDSVLPTPITGALPGNLRGTVGSAEVHVLVMERGRTPDSRMPPIGPIQLWMTRHGIPITPESVFLIRRAIGRRGIRGWPRWMFRNAARRGRRVIAGIIVRHLRTTP